MKKMNLNTTVLPGLLALSMAAYVSGCKKAIEPTSNHDDQSTAALMKKPPDKHEEDFKKVGHFTQVNLTANNNEYGASNIDPTLVNAWGLVFNPNNAVAWISSQAGHVSNVYSSEGVPLGINPVNIPSPGGNTGGNPTGIVFNGNASDFIIPANGKAAAFIFAGVDGVISAWNGSLSPIKQAIRIPGIGQGAYTGLAIATNAGKQYLYGANFATGKIDVWNSSWALQNSFPFSDHAIPQGYSPFNIQNVGGNLFVTYAKVDPVTHESEAGNGKGFVDVFSPNGSLIKRFASMGPLNAPWGVAMAPRSFFHHEMDEADDEDHHGHDQNYILIGNFGNGHINAYRMDGKFVGQLRGKKDPIVIEGLWAIMFPPPVNGIDTNRLYFTAGPDDENDGLFGYLLAKDNN
jgi:uncharacterized protein (TIGR03118 family)